MSSNINTNTVIVSVGTGPLKQEFKYSSAIHVAYLEYLVHSGQVVTGDKDEISFPDGDPEGWKLFYQFISPDNNLYLVKDTSTTKAKIKNSNVLKLLPWFHKFQMKQHVQACDKLLAQNWKGWNEGRSAAFWDEEKGRLEESGEFQTRIAERKDLFAEASRVYGIGVKYNLTHTKQYVGCGMVALMEKHLLETSDLFDLPVIESLVNSIIPLKLDQFGRLKMVKKGGCKPLLSFFNKILSPDTGKNLTQGIVDDPFRLAYILENHKTNVAAKQIIINMMFKGADRMYKALPDGRRMESHGVDKKEKINEYGKRKYKAVWKAEYEGGSKHAFKHLRLEP